MNCFSGEQDHVPVLISSIIDRLPQIRGVWIDGTFGAGGYTKAILSSGANFVIGIDRDPEVEGHAARMLNRNIKKFIFVNDTFSNLCTISKGLGFHEVQGVMLDLGVSSMQIDTPKRGFSFRYDGPLDMRMSKNGLMAEEVVNQFSEFELANIFYKLGEERKSRQIAREIVRCREKAKISSTLDLAQIIESVIPSNAENRIHPATRCFQALRIYINHELEELEKALHAAQEVLSIGGFLIVISFHSLEDRIVKNFLRNSSVSYPKSNRYYPEFNLPNPTFEIVTRKPIIASKNERKNNPRASSAKCRIAIRNDHSNHLKEEIEKL